MNKHMTPAEFLVLRSQLPTRPGAGDELLAAIQEEGSPVRSWLTGVEAWAKSSLPTVNRSEPRTLLPIGEQGDVARVSALTLRRNRKRRDGAIIPSVVAEYMRVRDRTAPTDMVARVLAALNDPASELRRVLSATSRR